MFKGLEGRLQRIESKIKPTLAAPEHDFDLDGWLATLELVPATVRELARSKGSSVVEATCEMLGIEVREFKRLLQEKTIQSL